MGRTRAILSAFAIVFAGSFLSPDPLQATDKPGMKLYVAETEFDDAAFELENAIVDRGLKIDFRGHIGAMMERTANDFGGDRGPYKDAQFITFCSVPLSRDMMKPDPHNMGFCPYIVFLYELRAEPGKTYIGYREPVPSGSKESIEAVNAVDKLLDDIVKQASE